LTAAQLAEYEKYSLLKAKKAEIKLKQIKERQKQLGKDAGLLENLLY
jgi:hypothetical protein